VREVKVARLLLSLIGGWRALVFALCALLLGVSTWWYRDSAQDAIAAQRVAEAAVAVLEAQRDSANALALDYQARADAARAAEAEAKDAAKKADAARARKWGRINESEKAWSEQPVPDAVVEGLR
jgi:hypothetical protein